MTRHWVDNDPDRAACGPIGYPIAHAHLVLSLLPSLFRQILVVEDGGSSMFSGYNRVRAPSPVPVGGRIRLSGHAVQDDDVTGGIQHTVELVVEAEARTRRRASPRRSGSTTRARRPTEPGRQA